MGPLQIIPREARFDAAPDATGPKRDGDTQPMKSEPPTQTRAPDNQFRKMQDALNSLETPMF